MPNGVLRFRPPTTPTSPLWPLALARMMMGVLWLYALRWKLPPGFEGRGERTIEEWLQLEVDHAAFAIYGRLIDAVVLPNVTLFSWVVFLLEFATGMSLLTGAFTRTGAAVGLAMSINLGIGLLAVPGEWPWSYVMMAMWHGTLLVTAAGRMWGIDQLRDRSEFGPTKETP